MSETKVAISGHTRKHTKRQTSGSVLKRPMISLNIQRPNNIPHNLIHDAVRIGCDSIIIFRAKNGSLHIYFQSEAISQVDLIPFEKTDGFLDELKTFFPNRINVFGKFKVYYNRKERVIGKTIELSLLVLPKGEGSQAIITIQRFEKNGKKKTKKGEKRHGKAK